MAMNMNEQTKKQAIGLGVVLLLIIGTPLVLSQFVSQKSEQSEDSQTREITVEADSGSDSEQSWSSETKNADQSKVAADSEDDPDKRAGQQAPEAEDDASPQFSMTNDHESDGADQDSEDSASDSLADTGKQVPAADSESTETEASQPSQAASNQTQESETADTAKPDTSDDSRANKAGQWVVQIASFKTRAQAKQLIGELDDQYASFYAAGEVDGTTYYRVRVGPFENKAQAGQAVKRLESKERQPYLVKRS